MERSLGRGSPEFGREMARRLDVLAIAALILLVLTLVLIGIALSLPWWAFFTNGNMSAWYLNTTCSGGTCQSYSGDPALRDTFGLTGGLVTWGLALYVLALAVFALSIPLPRFGILVLILGALGSVLLMVAPVYLYFALPGALSSSGFPVPVDAFFGSASRPGFPGTTNYSWTGAAGWFLSWVVLLFSFVATGVAFLSARRRLRDAEIIASVGSAAARGGRAARPMAASGDKFCPVCGARYPGGTQFCSNDAAPLKDLV